MVQQSLGPEMDFYTDLVDRFGVYVLQVCYMMKTTTQHTSNETSHRLLLKNVLQRRTYRLQLHTRPSRRLYEQYARALRGCAARGVCVCLDQKVPTQQFGSR